MAKKRRVESCFTVPVAVIENDHYCDIALVEFRDGGYCVVEVNTDPDAWEDDFLGELDETSSYLEALELYKQIIEREAARPVEPNWDAQNHYDSVHGTINGSDPRIVAWQEEFANEC